MRRIIAAILVLVSILTLSGCKGGTNYWDGLTKRGAKEYIQNTLQEKYGEEFVVLSMGVRSGQYYRELVGTCSPKSDDSIAFEFEVNHFSEDRKMFDNYIQNVVRKQLKHSIDEVLSKNYDNFASEVYVTPLKKLYDSKIFSADDVSVKNFSESFSQNNEDDANETSVWIILDANSPINIEKLSNTVQDIVVDFHFLNVCIDCFYADQATIDLCNEKANSTSDSRWEVQIITRNGNFRWERFYYYGDGKGLMYIGNNLG